MKPFTLEQAHRRHNPLLDEWVLVSPQRGKRPWQGQVEQADTRSLPKYDPGCYLCPGNVRANGERNPDYSGVHVFRNDFPAFMDEASGAQEGGEGLFRWHSEPGINRVICFSEHHGLTLPEMDQGAIVQVVRAWQKEFAELGALPHIRHVQIFENKGSVMGCSNPHLHG